jgi:hypothetical protein
MRRPVIAIKDRIIQLARWEISRRASVLVLVGAVLLMFVIGLATIRCKSWHVVYILPVGYRGLVTIEYDPANGVEPERQGDNCIYRINADGRCRSTKDWHILRSHSFTATYSDGTPVLNGFHAPEAEIALRRVLSHDSKGLLHLLVGTDAERQVALQALGHPATTRSHAP